MSSPERSDHEPYLSDLVAVVDETSPEIGGAIHYVVTASVVVDAGAVTGRLQTMFGSRSRPFHWTKEGTQSRELMIGLLVETGMVAHARYESVGRRGQIGARGRLLPAIAADVHHEGAGHLIIESSDAVTNSRDRAVLLDAYKGRGGVPFHYDWRTKNDPIVWVADALCGAVLEHLTQQEPQWLELLQAGGVLDSLLYGSE